jgi:ABC-type polysaccharide/polyol phosphate export permease
MSVATTGRLTKTPTRHKALWRIDLAEMLREFVMYRELLYQMTRRDLLLRYKQTIMGVAWAVLMPLTNTAVFSVIFMRVVALDVGMPYPLFAYVGLASWNFFASSTRFAVNSLTSNPNLVSKVYFPREVFPFSAVIVSLVDFAVSAVVIAILMAYYGIVPSATLLLIPVVLVVQVMLTAGCCLLLAVGNLFFRDVKYLFEVFISIAMFATSAVYPSTKVGGVLGLLVTNNPLTILFDAYRDLLVFGRLPALMPFAAVAAFSVVFFGIAWFIFHRSEFKFAESI